MKPKNELLKTELTNEELGLLIDHYNQAIGELDKAKSPILRQHREACFQRREDLTRMFDGRWLNRGKGRKRAAPADVTPELPMSPISNERALELQAGIGITSGEEEKPY